jgi:diaminopimelate epimerase
LKKFFSSRFKTLLLLTRSSHQQRSQLLYHLINHFLKFKESFLEMKFAFTKMHGAGNDFVVIDCTQSPLHLTREQILHLGNRRLGVGADQILLVEKSLDTDADFVYRIFNNDGGEVEQCGNGSRCFARFLRDKGLTQSKNIKVRTKTTYLELRLEDDDRVTVDMNAPVLIPKELPFLTEGLQPELCHEAKVWPILLAELQSIPKLVVVSMGNPHAVLVVDDVNSAPVNTWGPLLESHARFPNKVNVGFMQVLDRRSVKLRVYERGAGETLSCGTGACAAVVAGILQGLLDSEVNVQTLGGFLTVHWAGSNAHVWMTGPATTVFEGEIEL